MKKSLVLAALSLAIPFVFVACDNDVDGVLQASQPVRMIDHKGRDFTLVPGTSIAANVDVDGDAGKQKLKIKLKNFDSGKDRDFELKIPSNMVLPTYSGSFAIPGAAVGQAFDVAGTVLTQEHDSARSSGTESCSEIVRERQCTRVRRHDAATNRDVWDDVCEMRDVTAYGRRDVEYHTHYGHVDAALRMLPAGAATMGAGAVAPLASFTGSRDWANQVNDYTGRCDLGGRGFPRF